MRFDRIRLSNFKCYADADLELDRGVTVIHGLNGSGKSSLLEAAFFALYGARALEKNLEEVVTIGEEEAEVELWFTHDGEAYHLRRRIRESGDRVQTAECVLETPSGSIDGARDVRSYATDLLRMDAEAFVNCAYVRQGEVNKLINASPGDRQDMLDDLLQLGKLEEYRERAGNARLGVKSVLDAREALLGELDAQIEQKEDKDLHDRLNALKTEFNELEETRERYEENREEARDTLDEAEAVLEQHEERREELADVTETVEDLQAKIAETEQERSTLEDDVAETHETIQERRERVDDLLTESDLDADADVETVTGAIEDLEAENEDLRDRIEERRREIQGHSKDAERLAENAEEYEQRAAAKREEADDLEAAADDAEGVVEEREEKLDSLADRIEEKRAAFEDAPVAFGESEAHREALRDDLADYRERETDLVAELETARSRVEEAEELLEAGKCPECGQPVEDSPHVDALAERRERVESLTADLADLREEKESVEDRLERAEELVGLEGEVEDLESQRSNLRQLVDEKRDALAERREQAADLREQADDLDEQAEDAREAAAEKREQADEGRQAIGDLNQQRTTLNERIERLTEVREELEAIADAEDRVEQRRDRRAQLAELNDERRDRLADARERKSALEEEYDEDRLEELRAEKERAEAYLEQVDAQLEELHERRDALQGKIGGVEQELTDLEDLRERRAGLAERVDAVRSLYDEASSLESMYGDLRAELRQRNVDTLERLLNETFDLVYQNDSYSRIALSGDYELTVYQKDGEPLDPDQLSGGERALFNLSLRTAIYRLLAEGIDGAAPMPPLILDEPTVFLDAGHVSQLVELVQSMQSHGVEQIVVVSHDDLLVDAADDLVRVHKDSTTNRSHVERVVEATVD